MAKPEDKQESRFFAEDHRGSVSNYIGTGKYAKTNIVYTIIKWSFIVAGSLTIIIVIMACSKITQFSVESITTIWKIFIPLITLSLGYLFGKGQD